MIFRNENSVFKSTVEKKEGKGRREEVGEKRGGERLGGEQRGGERRGRDRVP